MERPDIYIIGEGMTKLESRILEMMATQGPFVLLFVYLLFYVLKQNSKREAKYQETIDKNQETINKLADSLSIVKDIRDDVMDLKRRG